jgi:hypothetical protein
VEGLFNYQKLFILAARKYNQLIVYCVQKQLTMSVKHQVENQTKKSKNSLVF